MAGAASHPQLKRAFIHHRPETETLLHLSLEEERQFDALLTGLAKREINRHAMAA